MPEEESKDNNGRTVAVYLCRCRGQISDHIDIEEVARHTSLLSDARVVVSHDALCSSEGRTFLRKISNGQAASRVVIGACSPEVLDIPLTQDLEEEGINKYLVNQVDLREQCAWVHSNIREASAKASALIRGSIQRNLRQEPLEDLTFPIEGAVLIVGAGEAGSIAAQRIAASGFRAYLVDRSSEDAGEDTSLEAVRVNSNCKACALADSKECPTAPSTETLKSSEGIKLFLASEIQSISGGVGRWHVTVKTRDGTEEFDVGGIMITAPPSDRAPGATRESTESYSPVPAEVRNGLAVSVSREGPSEDTGRVLQMLHIGRGEDMTVRHLLSRHLPDLNRAIFVLESSLGLEDAACAIQDAANAADVSISIMRKKTASMPRIIARVEEYRCRGCGKCADVCEYDAVSLVEREGGIKVAHIDESRCEGCGLCRVACCNGAMALLGYTTTQLLANMMGVIEEVGP